MNGENVHLAPANGMCHKIDALHGPQYDVRPHPSDRGGPNISQTPFRIRETEIGSY